MDLDIAAMILELLGKELIFLAFNISRFNKPRTIFIPSVHRSCYGPQK